MSNLHSRRKFFQYSALGAVGAMTAFSANSQEQSTPAITVDVFDYGAVGDGVADDTSAIQQAINQAQAISATLILGEKHLVSSSLNISGNIAIKGRFPFSDIITTSATDLFLFSGDFLSLTNLKTSNISIVSIQGDFDTLTIKNCYASDNLSGNNKFFITSDVSSFSFVDIQFEANNIESMGGMLIDGAQDGVVSIDSNTFIEATQFVFRSIPSSNQNEIKGVTFTNNTIEGMNGGLSDSSTVARVVQVGEPQDIVIHNNIVRDLKTTTAANLVYFRGGNLSCLGNQCYNAQGQEAWIHDKGVSSGNHVIKHNIFDQSGIQTYDLDCVIKIYSGHNFTVSDNDFIGLRSPACWVWESISSTTTSPANNTIENNKIRSVAYPFAFKLVQPSSNTVIKNNTLFDIHNDDQIVQHGEKTPKFIFLYVSVSNGRHLENIVIDGNTMLNSPNHAEFIRVYRHSIATTSDIKGLYISNNLAHNISVFCKFIGLSIDSCAVINNSGLRSATTISGSNLPNQLMNSNNNFG